MSIKKKIDRIIKTTINEKLHRNDNIEADDIGEFWIVTYPTHLSTLVDILIKLPNILHLFNQVRGGLEEKDIAGVFTNKQKATTFANKLLKEKQNI